MEVHKGNIFGILNGDKQFLIPVYQRYYSWELSVKQKSIKTYKKRQT